MKPESRDHAPYPPPGSRAAARAIKMTSTPSHGLNRTLNANARRARRALVVDRANGTIASTFGAAHTRASTRDRRRALAHGSSSRVRARARSRESRAREPGRWRCAPASARARRSRRRRCATRRDARWTREKTRGDAESAREGSDGIGARDRARATRAKRDGGGRDRGARALIYKPARRRANRDGRGTREG